MHIAFCWRSGEIGIVSANSVIPEGVIKNVQPILTAFCRWVDHHVSVRRVRAAGCGKYQS